MNTDIFFNLGEGMKIKNKDTAFVSGYECLVQEIKIEAITAQGDLWYDVEYGWSLQDFLHRNIDDMLKLEIYHRVKTKMANRSEVLKESIKVSVEELNDAVCIHIRFSAYGKDVVLVVALDRVKAEVKIIG